MADRVPCPVRSDDEANDELEEDDEHSAKDVAVSPSWLKQYPAQYLPERSDHANDHTPPHTLCTATLSH
jgi:hypothetical protein